MADSKITALGSIGTGTDPANDQLVIVDVSDVLPTGMALSGTTKRVGLNQLLSSSPTATGAFSVTGLVTAGSATITGDLTVDTSTLKVDSTNNRVGIGTASPTVTLDVVGAARFVAAATGPKLSIENAGGSTRFKSTDTSSFYYSAYDHNFTNTDGSVNRYYIDQNGVSTWYVSGTTAMTLNSTGLGIGGSPTGVAKLYAKSGAVTLGAVIETSGASSLLSFADAGTSSYTRVQIGSVGNTLVGIINGVQAMTLDASGNLLVGKTASSTSVAGAQVQPDGTHSAVKSDANPGFFYNTTTAISGTIALFRSNGVTVGTITQDGTNTAYVTSSDYRLKEAVQPMSGGLARVSALKPSIYKWKSNGSTGEGFLAHELAEVVPAAVVGTKDALNEDGTINPQGIDLSKIVPILVAAIQELTAEVNALKNA